ncbi:unnamed protein product, partial [Linum tenue]
LKIKYGSSLQQHSTLPVPAAVITRFILLRRQRRHVIVGESAAPPAGGGGAEEADREEGFQETRHPVYRGVRSRKGDKWVCELREPNTGTRVWLGTYPDPEMAARAHDVAALAFRGKSACLNFADSAWRLPIPASTDTDDVRRAAAEAAEMFRPGGGSETEAADEHEHVDNNAVSSSTTPILPRSPQSPTVTSASE